MWSYCAPDEWDEQAPPVEITDETSADEITYPVTMPAVWTEEMRMRAEEMARKGGWL